MTTEASFPDRVAAQAARAAAASGGAEVPAALHDLVQQSVLIALGCTCTPAIGETARATNRACPVHGVLPRVRDRDEPVMTSRAISWEDDPYDGYTARERRDGVQDGVRTATEAVRSLRSELRSTIQRGQMAHERLEQSIAHATSNGGLTYDELDLAELALSAVEYALRLLYAASNHVGDKHESDGHR